MSVKTCYACGATPGQYHKRGCDWEDCPHCGLQLLWCGHMAIVRQPERMPFRELETRERAALEYGWYCILVPGRGWRLCRQGTPNCRLNLNRVMESCDWDKEQKKWVVRMGKRRIRSACSK
jgi:hypothetical protein